MNQPRLTSCLLAGALSFAAGCAFLGIFGRNALVPVLAAATFVPAAIACATWKVRWTSAIVGVQLIAAIATFALVVGRDADGGPLAAIAHGIIDGWSSLLTSVVPAPPRAELLAVPFFVGWAATAAVAELARRTKAPLLPLAPVLAVVVVAELAGPARVDTPRWAIGAVLVVGVVFAAMRSLATNARGQVVAMPSLAAAGRRLVQAAPLLLVIVLAGTIAGASVPIIGSRAPWRIRERVVPPQEDVSVGHPLSNLASAYRNDPELDDDPRDDLLYRVHLDRPAPGTTNAEGQEMVHLPLVAYDRYDGITWSSSAPFRPVGDDLPLPDLQPTTDTATEPVTQTIEVVDAEGRWLPTLPGPVEADVPGGVAYDGLAGTIIGEGQVERGTTYTVRSEVPQPPAIDDPSVTAGLPPTAVDFLSLDGGNAEVASYAARFQQIATAMRPYGASYGAQLRSIEDLFHNKLRTAEILSASKWVTREEARVLAFPNSSGATPDVDPVLNSTPTGHAIARIATFLYTPDVVGAEPPPNAGLGTPEQFATAAALLGRAMGIPTRLVVGYTVPNTGSTDFEVRRRDADAWVEVWSPTGGWLPLDVTPASSSVEQLQVTTTSSTTTSTTAAPTGSELPPLATVAPPPTTIAEPESSPVAAIASIIGTVILLVVVALCVLALSVRTARARHRTGAPDERLAGAWSDALRTLRLADVEVSDSDTTTEAIIACHAAGLPTDDLDALGRAVVKGACAPAPATADETKTAWHHADALRRTVGRSGHGSIRWRLLLDPRSGPKLPEQVPKPRSSPPPNRRRSTAAPPPPPERSGELVDANSG